MYTTHCIFANSKPHTVVGPAPSLPFLVLSPASTATYTQCEPSPPLLLYFLLQLQEIGGSERESEMGREGNGKVNFGERQWESRRE